MNQSYLSITGRYRIRFYCMIMREQEFALQQCDHDERRLCNHVINMMSGAGLRPAITFGVLLEPLWQLLGPR